MEACTTGQTLCWRCRRATNAPGMGCSWSRRADPEPVEGWEARETTLKGSDYYHGKNYTTIIQSYVIRTCPLFYRTRKRAAAYIQEVDSRSGRRVADNAGDEGAAGHRQTRNIQAD